MNFHKPTETVRQIQEDMKQWGRAYTGLGSDGKTLWIFGD